ncbi:unnamed protein product [Prorocentrum cordatum]|uniref:Secreted protein n=1 Tax=Prorocentrum cordatum TaxID=2364126 RepID=A0ABN9UBV3_9DINO|nr:unnamed protein product [Polarella glacialis]
MRVSLAFGLGSLPGCPSSEDRKPSAGPAPGSPSKVATHLRAAAQPARHVAPTGSGWGPHSRGQRAAQVAGEHVRELGCTCVLVDGTCSADGPHEVPRRRRCRTCADQYYPKVFVLTVASDCLGKAWVCWGPKPTGLGGVGPGEVWPPLRGVRCGRR